MSLTVTIVTMADEQLLPMSTKKHPKKYYAEQSSYPLHGIKFYDFLSYCV